MSDVAAQRRLTGREQAHPAPLELRAGPLTALLDGPDLRHVRAGGVELVQRVYVAVRDAPWNTIPASFSDWQRDIGPDRFRITFRASHRYEGIAFDWDGSIEGGPTASSATRWMASVTASSPTRRSASMSTTGWRARSAGRTWPPPRMGQLTGILPDAIAPQRIVDGTLSGMFAPYSEIAIEVADGLEAVVSLDGDLLELQDHRNWTDANFKSYGTPLALGFPFDSTDGQRIRQVLTISGRGEIPLAAPPADPVIRLATTADGPLPALGLGSSTGEAPLAEREVGLLRQVRSAHLRVDLALGDDGWRAVLQRAKADAAALDTGLELALSVNETHGEALAALAKDLGEGCAVARVLIYPASDGFSAMLSLTPASLVRLVREHLEPVTGTVVFAGGTNQNFSDINRDRPTDPVLTGVCFSISPTVHAADDASIIENQAGAAEVVRMARSFSGDRAICVSPVTIATRFGPYPDGPAAPGDPPPSVDVRQASLLGAAWTVGELKHLAEAGAASVTLFEPTGWRGIVGSEAGNPMPERFPSAPGDAFPIFHVLADLAEWRDGRIVATTSSQPLEAVALAVETRDGARHVLAANVSPSPIRVILEGLPDGPVHRRDLDAASAEAAATDPAAFRTAGTDAVVSDGRLVLDLAPYAFARIDPA